MWNYYKDITLYAVGITIFTTLASAGVYDSFGSALVSGSFIFSVFGTGLGILAFNYFQKTQYYMYYNLGFSKSQLIIKTWTINFFIGILLAILIAIVF